MDFAGIEQRDFIKKSFYVGKIIQEKRGHGKEEGSKQV